MTCKKCAKKRREDHRLFLIGVTHNQELLNTFRKLIHYYFLQLNAHADAYKQLKFLMTAQTIKSSAKGVCKILVWVLTVVVPVVLPAYAYLGRKIISHIRNGLRTHGRLFLILTNPGSEGFPDFPWSTGQLVNSICK